MRKRIVCITLTACVLSGVLTGCGSTDYSAFIDDYGLWGTEDNINYWYVYISEDAEWSEGNGLENNKALALYAIRKCAAMEENEDVDSISVMGVDYNGDTAFSWDDEYLSTKDELLYYHDGKYSSIEELDDDEIDESVNLFL